MQDGRTAEAASAALMHGPLQHVDAAERMRVLELFRTKD